LQNSSQAHANITDPPQHDHRSSYKLSTETLLVLNA
jgi:hypothetical protein